MGIESLKEISKSRVFTVLRRLPKRNWSQVELSLAEFGVDQYFEQRDSLLKFVSARAA